MTVPASYTNEELAEYMERVIGPLSDVLGLRAVEDRFFEPVHNVLLYLDANDASEVEDIRRLRIVAELEAWKLVRDVTVGYYDLRTPDGETYNRSEIHEHAVAMVNRTEAKLAEIEGSGMVRRSTVIRVPDPYRRTRNGGEFG